MKAVVVVVAVVAFVIACDPPIVDPDASIATGTTPNDVVLSTCGASPTALVTASGDARLDVLSLDGGAARAVFLDEGSQPWMVDVASDRRAVVALFGSDEVALVAPCDERVLSRAQADVVIDVDPPLVLREATDADGDGVQELTVARMRPRTPQAVAVVGDDQVFITFTNIFAFALGDDPMLTGPGVLARFSLEGDVIVFRDALTLPCENPGGISSDGAVVVVACSGRFIATNGGHERQSPGGLVVVDAELFSIARSIELADFSPGTPAFLGTDIVVGGLLGGELRRFSAELELVDSVVLGGASESIFSVVPVGDDVAAVLFLAGALVLSPFGAATEIEVAGAGPARGLIDAVIVDDDVLGLLTLSAELVTVELP
ncbi:MAG: hypothetical protein Q8O67_08150 [Deltaproteobacteria bacterium]|nr:hypothetical protein [Deltaproteobacteria bacterium]